MTESEALTFITERFATIWTATPIEYDNVNIDKDSLDEWVRLTIRPMDARRLGFGNSTRRYGVVYVQVFVKEMIGSGRAIELATTAGDVFGLIRKNSLVFTPYDLTVVGDSSSLNTLSEKISWFQVNCAIEYNFIDDATTLQVL